MSGARASVPKPNQCSATAHSLMVSSICAPTSRVILSSCRCFKRSLSSASPYGSPFRDGDAYKLGPELTGKGLLGRNTLAGAVHQGTELGLLITERVSLDLLLGFDAGPGFLRDDRPTHHRQRAVRFEITLTTHQSLDRWILGPEMLGHEFLSPSRIHRSPHPVDATLGTDCPRLRHVAQVGDCAFGTHSLRQTKVAQIFKRTGTAEQFNCGWDT